MDFSAIVSMLHGWLFLLAAFAFTLGIAMFKGRQALINLMAGSYFGLLLYQQFPYLDILREQAYGQRGQAIVEIFSFLVFALLSTWLFARLMPREFWENTFESLGRKILLAAAATVLIFTLAAYFLPVGELVSIGTPLPEAVLSDRFAFLWLLLPLVILFLI